MKLPYLSLLLLLTLNSKGQNQNIKKFNYAFENDGKIYVNSESEKKTYLIAKGSDPYLSPDGKKIAYTDYFGSDGRRIAILDLNSKIKDTLNIHNNNYYGPVWSPDGNYIAFNLFEGNNWIIKIIDKNYNQITTIGTSNHSYYSPSWTTNSKNLIMQDLDSIYFFSLDGRLKSKYNLREVTDGHGNSSSTNFQITPDNKYLLFNGDSDDPSSGDGPSYAIYSCELSNMKITRITPKGMDCTGLFFKDYNNILFGALKNKSKYVSIYSIIFTSKEIKLLFEKGNQITSSMY